MNIDQIQERNWRKRQHLEMKSKFIKYLKENKKK